jgi:hypothetical protein
MDAEKVGGINLACFDDLVKVCVADQIYKRVVLSDNVVVYLFCLTKEISVQKHRGHFILERSVGQEDLLLLDRNLLYDGAVEKGAVLLIGQTNCSGLENHDTVVSLFKFHQIFSRIEDLTLELFGQVNQCILL